MLSSDTPVASSTWLDRLRLSKGLSTTEDEDASGTPLSLDDFLRRNHSTSDSPPSAPTPSDPELTDSPSDPNPGEWYGVMSDVLSELFNYSGSSRSTATVPVKKLPRKQSNPKHCSVETPPPPPPQRPKFATEKREKKRRRVVEEEDDGVEEEEEEEEGEKDLVGFSRSEVTVIDTSFKIWKAEKVVFRRRNVWKVRDKKGNSRGVVSSKKKKKKKTIKMKKKKKRKCDVDGGEIGRKSKKMKLSRSVSDNSPHYSSEDLRDDPQSSNANRTLLHCHLNQEAYYILARRTANLRLVAIGLWPDRATKLNLCLYVYDDSVV
ncbi:unnamed protein product [Brassica napus]|uniref:(rape) hypothetical protein n=1 Tax=Brassica napus TaxID=3708 RepID=A0A816XDN9_BRANA|nr:unnamed protein product [Brassica napus]